MTASSMRKAFWLLALALLAGRTWAQESQPRQVAVPRNDVEIRKAMSITYNQHILPEGAKPELLEHLTEVGEVVVYYDHPPVVPWMSAAGILVNAPAEVVFSTLSDFERYKDYVPFTESAQVLKISDNLEQVNYHLKVAMFFLQYRVDYGVYHYNRPPYRTDWCHAWGEFGINVGFWELIPTADGKRTMAFYSVFSQPRSPLIKTIYSRDPSLELMTNVSTAVMMTRAVKAEAEKRYKAVGGKIAPPAKTRKIFDVLAEDPASMKKFLERGKLLVLEDGPTVYVTGGALVDAPRETSWQVVTDFPRYPSFAPGTKKVEYLGMGPRGPRYHWEVFTDMVFLEYKYSYDPEFIMNPPESITFNSMSSAGTAVNGFWRLLDSAGKTLIFSGTTADIRSMGVIPRYALSKEPTLEHAILSSQALTTINAVKAEIEKKSKTGAKGK